jgi:hypothetical protein
VKWAYSKGRRFCSQNAVANYKGSVSNGNRVYTVDK